MEPNEVIKIQIDTQEQWNEKQKEEVVKTLAANFIWFVPLVAFVTYLMAYTLS